MRCFVALDLPPAARAALLDAIAPLRRLGDVKWVADAQLHVTLRFLGDASAAQVEALSAVLQEDLPPLRLALRGLGQFPPRGAPRVLWAGLDGDLAALAELAHRCERAAVAAGAAAEPRPFHPHVTIGRTRSPRGARPLAEALQQCSAAVRGESFVPESVALYRSELGAQGPVHTPLARALFRG